MRKVTTLKIGQTEFLEPRLIATRTSKTWVNVRYRPTPNDNWVSFNVRPKFFNELYDKPIGKYGTMAESAYYKWTTSTSYGKYYTGRRHVEGMLKTAQRKGDMDQVETLEQMLRKMSDKQLYAFYDAWTKSLNDASIDDYFDYDGDNELEI